MVGFNYIHVLSELLTYPARITVRGTHMKGNYRIVFVSHPFADGCGAFLYFSLFMIVVLD